MADIHTLIGGIGGTSAVNLPDDPAGTASRFDVTVVQQQGEAVYNVSVAGTIISVIKNPSK